MSPLFTITATMDADGKPSSVFAFGPERATKAQAETDLDYFPASARMAVHTGITILGKLYYQVRMVATVTRGGCVVKSAMARYRCVKRNAPELVWASTFINSYDTRDAFESAVWVLS